VNCSYFTCWYAHQVVTNQPVTGWPGNYHEEVQKIRENHVQLGTKCHCVGKE